MPIRTNRGRAAVYRRLWGAPMRSPRHLAITVGLLVVLVSVIGFVLPRVGPGDDRVRTAGEDTPAAVVPPTNRVADPLTTSAPPETRLTEDPLTPTSAPASPQALSVAEKWAAAFVDHPEGVTVEEWLKKLAPYTTEEYLPVLRSVDPSRIDARRVTGKATSVSSYTSSVDAKVPTDGKALLITVIATDSGWRVASHDQAS